MFRAARHGAVLAQSVPVQVRETFAFVASPCAAIRREEDLVQTLEVSQSAGPGRTVRQAEYPHSVRQSQPMVEICRHIYSPSVSHSVDFVNVSTVGLESSPAVAASPAGGRTRLVTSRTSTTTLHGEPASKAKKDIDLGASDSPRRNVKSSSVAPA